MNAANGARQAKRKGRPNDGLCKSLVINLSGKRAAPSLKKWTADPRWLPGDLENSSTTLAATQRPRCTLEQSRSEQAALAVPHQALFKATIRRSLFAWLRLCKRKSCAAACLGRHDTAGVIDYKEQRF